MKLKYYRANYNQSEMASRLMQEYLLIGLFKDFGRAWSHLMKEITGNAY